MNRLEIVRDHHPSFPYKLEEQRWLKRTTWQLKWSLLPRRCELSGRTLWFRLAYQGVLIIYGPGDPVTEVRWHDPDEHLLWRLRE